jgi:hypothetical protein
LGLVVVNPLTLELNPSAQRCLLRFLLGTLIFKELTARRLYKSFGVKGLSSNLITNIKPYHQKAYNPEYHEAQFIPRFPQKPKRKFCLSSSKKSFL